MKIAIISTCYMTTPPVGYGGIERVVHMLTEQLVAEGHDVTLFATPGSSCSGKTITVDAYNSDQAPAGIHNKGDILSEEPLYQAVQHYLEDHEVDIIHDWSFENLFVRRHSDRFPFIISTCVPPPKGYQRPNLVACSKAHADLFGDSTKFVHYGLPLDKWDFSYEKSDHFIHISKIAKYKAQHLAVLAARRAKVPLQLAGNVEGRAYYNLFLKPLLWMSKNVQHIGEVQGTSQYLMEAKALVQTPRWFDAFPLVILEAFASGTPVIALDAGGVKEQIVEGVNGFLCQSVDDLSYAMRHISDISPKTCRNYAEEHFSVQRMVRDYVRLYEQRRAGESW